ncbi:hypothetical protein V495_06397 [Pseudogymnoascus sp. VKM F-4514 (FW-929)]|nr:hypothetical protein V495_06397 [Pseudogymnoascus sp. VKM F-4514 (FW-929)]KFY54890.1 hypothetical protein V497_07365 [Pseudogymnoascus sp. VKM F-4516 (FW-969)]
MYSTRASIRLKCTARRVSTAKCAYATTSYSTPAPNASRLTDQDISAARSYCSTLVQKFDSPSYTLQTFIQAPSRDAYLAIRALNIELSRIPDLVSNPTIGALRMQFWRDNITRTFANTPPKEPVAILLHHALQSLKDRHPNAPTSSLKAWFMKVINAREQYMDNRPYPTMEALESYAEATYSTLMYLTLGFLPLHSMLIDHLASHIGKAAGISAVLRGMPLIAFPPPPNHHSNSGASAGSLGGEGAARQGAVLLPLDVMAETNTKQEDVLRQGPNAPGLKDAVFQVATRANDHLITARNMLQRLQEGKDMGHDFEHEGEEGHNYGVQGRDLNVSQGSAAEELARGFGVLMPAVSTRLWLEKLEKADFDIFKEEVRGRSLSLPWSAYWAYKRTQL